MLRKTIALSSLLALSLGACAAGDSDPQGDRADDPDSELVCIDVDPIAIARAELEKIDPFFAEEGWTDDVAGTKLFDDVNGDGVGDLLVYPGMSASGAMAQTAILVSDSEGCLSLFAGDLGFTSEVAVDDRSTGLFLDIMATAQDGQCTTVTTRYTFDGSSYQAQESQESDLCGGE